MDKEEIKYYLKMVDELGAKLTEEDKETYAWLIYGYNQCAKLLNETEQQCKKQKEVIDKLEKYIEKQTRLYGLSMPIELGTHLDNIMGMLKEVSE
jgi:hypothetical protein